MSARDFALHELGEDATLVRRTAAPMVVGAANDRAEVEADRIADQVINRLQSGEHADQEQHVHNGCHGVARSAARSAPGAAEVGFEGGALSDGLSDRIDRARSGGRQLDDAVRRRLEPAFGGSLADVRVHTGKEAAELNRAVSAKAFTTGRDIFFGEGQYSPDTPGGERMLAHELAHTRQQAGGSVNRIHRFSLKKPDFTKTKAVTVFDSGGSGTVAKFDDGSKNPLVVKVNQMIGNEVAVAGNLHAGMAEASGKSGGFKVTTPGVKLADDAERAAIKQAALALVDPSQARNFLAYIDSDKPVVIQTMSSGMDFKKIMKGNDLTTQDKSGNKVANKKSIAFRMLNEPGPFKSLAKHAPADAFMGMHDRMLVAYNPDNFMYDPKTKEFAFVDNTQNISGGYLVKNDKVTSRAAFDAWAALPTTAALDDPDQLAAIMHAAMFDQFAGISSDMKDPQAKKLFNKRAAEQKDAILGWMAAGIQKGRERLLTLLKKPLALVDGLPPETKAEALQSVIARRYVIEGVLPGQAWTDAGIEAQRLLPPPKKNTGPARAKAPWQKAQPRGRGNVAASGGARMPALPAVPGS